MKRRLTGPTSALLAAALVLLLVVPVALAEALVHVRVRGEGAPDGRVTLTPRDGGDSYSCETEERECRIDGVPGGQYIVRFEPEEGEAPDPRPAMIPPSGTVTLVVSAGSTGD